MAKAPDDALINECESRLGYHFSNRELLIRALTHSSAKTQTGVSNERLEFLGDSILGQCITEYLFHRLPEQNEGRLTRIKSVVVSSVVLAEKSRALEMQRFLIVGKGIAQRKTIPRSIFANVFEALVAAIYLDSNGGTLHGEDADPEVFRRYGLDQVRAFILRQLKADVEATLRNETQRNFKSLLQQYSQRYFTVTPTYQVSAERGPDHGKTFEVQACIGDERFAPGWGRSKRDAEQRAAEAALQVLVGDALLSNDTDEELLHNAPRIAISAAAALPSPPSTGRGEEVRSAE